MTGANGSALRPDRQPDAERRADLRSPRAGGNDNGIRSYVLAIHLHAQKVEHRRAAHPLGAMPPGRAGGL